MFFNLQENNYRLPFFEIETFCFTSGDYWNHSEKFMYG